jgi:hypothetical protein
VKRTPLKAKRDKPRRNEGRVQHGRVKPKPIKTGFDAAHMRRVAALPCLVCRRQPVTIHHVTASIEGGRIARSHKLIVPLCPAHHLHDHGATSVERLGHGGFYYHHRIDLLAEAHRLLRETEESL